MFSLFKTKTHNANAALMLLLKALAVKVSKSTIKETLEEHPEYPNLLSLSESLAEWHVPNQAYQIDKATYDPADLEFPFIAHLNLNGGAYLLVTKISDQRITYSNEMKTNGFMAEVDFLKNWSGVALHATKTAKSGEPTYHKNYLQGIANNLKLPLLLIAILLSIGFSMKGEALNFHYMLAFTLKFAGIVVSILLLLHSIDANNPLIQNLCSLGNKNNCNAILKSDAAKVTSWLSWSEVGFFYFTGSFLALLLVPSSLALLAWLNVFALPYTVYSVSYQYRHKNWCVLCCAVQALLIGEFLNNVVTINIFNLQLSPITALILPLLLTFLLPILMWTILKTVLLKAALTKPLKQQLKKFKFNSELFQQVLQNQPKYSIAKEVMPIVLGNPNAEHIITMVSNPFCGPCAKAHQLLDEWLSYRDDIQLKIIFSTANHQNDEKTKVARHISALSLLDDAKIIENALNDWYKQGTKKYAEWALKYPVNFDVENSEVTTKQKAWCEFTEITATPTILVNGYKLPSPYRLEDIKYLVS